MKTNNQNAETVTLAGITLLKTSKVKILIGSAGASNYESFYENGVRYQVPTGKTLKIWAMKYFDLSNTLTGSAASLGYGDDPRANAATAPTNYVAFATGGDIGSMSQVSASSSVEFVVGLTVPAGKYPCVKQNAATSGTTYLLCEEV